MKNLGDVFHLSQGSAKPRGRVRLAAHFMHILPSGLRAGGQAGAVRRRPQQNIDGGVKTR